MIAPQAISNNKQHVETISICVNSKIKRINYNEYKYINAN